MEIIEIETPVPCPEAFFEITELSEYSRAAFLLSIGIQLNPPNENVKEELFETNVAFPLPKINKLESRVNSIELEQIIDFGAPVNDENLINSYARNIIEHLYYSEEDKWKHSIRLLYIFMNHPNDLLKVSAAISWIDSVEVSYDSEAISILLSVAIKAENDLVRDMAVTCLSRLYALLGFRGNDHLNLDADLEVIKSDSYIVHGTIFSNPGKSYEKWWEPNYGDLHKYLKNGSRPNLYEGIDYFKWSGGWNDYARQEGSEKLVEWVNKHDMHDTDAFAHSHGCNVAMLATQDIKVKNLILMSCPIHWNLYKPNFSNVKNILSIRVKWDLVIMADRGGQRFRDTRISEKVLPLWFTAHDASRKSNTWKKSSIDQYLP